MRVRDVVKKKETMAEQTNFAGVTLLTFTRKAKGGSASFSASLTSAIIKKMEWDDARDFEKGVQLEGELAAQTITLGAAGTLLTWTVDIEVNKVNGFQSVRRELENKRGKGFRHERHFKIHFADAKGARYLEEFIQSVPDGKGTMTVYHAAPAPKQPTLPGATTEDDKQESLVKN